MGKIIDVKQHKDQPRKDWGNKEWLQHAWIQSHNPWIDDDERQYWRDKISDLTRNNHSN